MALPEDILKEDDNDFFDIAGDVLAAPFRGVEGAVQGAYNLADYLSFDILPDYDTRFLGTSKTMAGGAVEGISQFATGFIPLFGLAGRAGALAKAGTVTKGVVAGAATDFTFFNGQEARLSNLIQQVPELQNPVTEFLAYDGDEGELEGRMKNVLEGLGLEAVAGTFIAGLKAIKRGRKVKEEGGTAEQQAQVVNDTLEGGKVFQIKGYHGSLQAKVVFEEGFDPAKLGSFTGAASAKEGFFFARKPKTARKYSGTKGPTGRLFEKIVETFEGKTPAVKPIKNTYYNYRDALQDPRQKQGLELVEEKLVESGLVNTKGKWNDKVKQGDVNKFLKSLDEVETQEEFAGGAVSLLKEAFNEAVKPVADKRGVIEATLSMNNPKIVDFKGANRTYADYVKAIKEAKKKGHDGAILKNTFDPMSDDIYVVFDPKQIGMNKIIDTADMPSFTDEARVLQKELDQDKARLDELLKKKEEGKATGADETRISMLERRIEGIEADIRVLGDVRTADVKERVRAAEEAELQERLETLDETIEDFEEVGERRPRPFKTYEEEGMMDIIPKGADTLKKRLMKKFPVKGADAQDAADVEKFIDVMGQRLFGDVSLSITNKIPSAGRYNFGNNLLQIRQSVIDEGGIKRTMIHELWHGLSRYLPKADVTSLTKQFDKARRDYIRSFGVDLDDSVDPATLLKKELPKELERFLKGKHTSENYRFKDVDEYFAEEMTDAFLKKLDEKDLAPTGTLKRIAQEVAIMFKDMFASLKAKLGIDQRQKIFNDFLKQRNVTKRAEAPLDMRGRLFADLPDFKKGKEDEFLSAVPEKFRGYAEELLKGGKPRLPQFALETGEDAIVLKELTEKYYEANPDKLTVADAVKDVDEEIRKSVEAQAEEGQDIEKTLLDIRITQQSYQDQGEALIQNISEIVKEFDATGGGTVSVAKLKNAFQQLLVVHDVHRRIGRGTAQTLQARRTNYGKRKIGITEAETGIEGIRNEFVNNSGNMKPERMIKLVKEHIDPNDPKGSFERLFNTAKKAQGKHFLDMPIEYWMNSILSGPKTQMVNIMGNALTQVMTTLEAVAGGIASGNMDVVKAVIASWSDSEMFKEAGKFAKQAFKDQDNLLDPSNRAFEEGQRASITGQRLQEGPMGSLVSDSAKDSIDKYANYIRLPSRLLLTSDEFFKQLAYRRAARMKAAMSGIQQGIRDPKGLARHINKTIDGIVTEGGRMMSEEGLVREAGIIADKKGLKGKDKVDFIIKHKDDNFNPDSSALMQYAAEEAQYLTFTKELQDKTLGKALQEATNKVPYLRLVVPFVRTPTNILKFAFERTPFVTVLKEERERLFAEFNSTDPILKARARGKVVTGALTVGGLIDVAFNNREYITGGGPSNEREKDALMATGWRPYSIKIGDTYYSYQRLDPLATPLGIVADLVETGIKEEKAFDESLLEHGVTSMMLALTRNATNKSYLAGIQMWADALGDPDRYIEKLGRNYTSSLVPNLISQVADYDTQAIKESRSVADAVKRKLGMRGSLDTKRNILGEEYKAEQWMGTGFINPIRMSTKKDDPILNEMASLNHAFRNPPPSLGGQIDMLEYENDKGQSAYDRQLELLKSVKLRGLTLRQTLNKLIKSRNYQRLSPDSEPGLPSPRIQQINSVLTKYRKEARRQMLREYPELNTQYAALTKARAGLRGGMQREDVLELLQQTN
jgi:hypothetical protein